MIHHPFRGELDHLIDCIRQDRVPMVVVEDAVKIVFAAELSARKGRPIKLPLPR